MRNINVSKKENIKNSSNYLAGEIAKQLSEKSSYFKEEEVQLLKFHGTYQQFNRDTGTELKQKGLEKEFYFMIRTKVPGGILSAKQYIDFDNISNQFSNKSLRITTRQTFQFHGVIKGNIKNIIRNVGQMLLTTYGACGDVVRNVTTIAAPIQDEVHKQLRRDALKISSYFIPASKSYGRIWINGEKYEYKKKENIKEPIYGKTYLPRKFKIGITIPEDNSVDVLTNDIAIFSIFKNKSISGYNIAIGGGLGITHNKPETFPYLAKPLLFCSSSDLINVLKNIVIIHRDYGDRKNRKHARLKYLVAEKGTNWIKNNIEKKLNKKFQNFKKIGPLQIKDHLDWHTQGNGKWYIGIFISSGRIEDNKNQQIKSGLRDIINRFQPSVTLSTDQNIILGNIKEEDRELIDNLLVKYSIRKENLSKVNRWFLACPALPTCGLALNEAERVSDDLIKKIEKILLKHDLQNDKFSIRITGCPNGCARPYAGDIGIVGRTPKHYALYSGGDFEGTRLNKKILDKVLYEDLPKALEQIFILFKSNRNNNETLGNFCNRIGSHRQIKKIKEVLHDRIQ